MFFFNHLSLLPQPSLSSISAFFVFYLSLLCLLPQPSLSSTSAFFVFYLSFLSLLPQPFLSSTSAFFVFCFSFHSLLPQTNRPRNDHLTKSPDCRVCLEHLEINDIKSEFMFVGSPALLPISDLLSVVTLDSTTLTTSSKIKLLGVIFNFNFKLFQTTKNSSSP